jgi:alkanesulfonate monooxygenase SsuD/methylene tetrahydromethanopterin reductase-like flavin-dependent oxidoreductase (luciferase family)
VTHDGPVYPMKVALVAPLPVQARLPIMIGGSGPKKTLRTLAKYGDQWNAMGSLEKLKESDGILRDHCAAVGRDQAEIERTTTVFMVIRDSREAARHVLSGQMAALGEPLDEPDLAYCGTPQAIAAGLRPLVDLGFRHIFVDTPAPYDLETIDRIGEVLGHLNG